MKDDSEIISELLSDIVDNITLSTGTNNLLFFLCFWLLFITELRLSISMILEDVLISPNNYDFDNF